MSTRTEKPKVKRCRNCRKYFEQFQSTQIACSYQCAITYSKTDSARKEIKKRQNRETREQKQKLKTKSDRTKEAQVAFNKFIRARDAFQPCISCDTSDYSESEIYKGGKWDCGHYRSIGSFPTLRFDELNAHKQCKKCNSQLSGNIVEYRIKLKERYGDWLLDYIEGPHEPKRYTKEDLVELTSLYRQKTRDIESGKESYLITEAEHT